MELAWPPTLETYRSAEAGVSLHYWRSRPGRNEAGGSGGGVTYSL